MAKSKANVRRGEKKNKRVSSRSLAIARRGIVTGHQFADMMSALMTDVIVGAISPGVSNAAVNAGGKLLKAVELQIKYGKVNARGEKILTLVARESPVEGRIVSATKKSRGRSV